MKNFFKSLFINNRFYWVYSANVLLFVMGYFFPFLVVLGKLVLLILAAFTISDLLLLYIYPKHRVTGKRECAEKFSNGDPNKVSIYVKNHFPVFVFCEIIDETPFQFQMRDFSIRTELKPGQEKHFEYILKPVERGEYEFGSLNIYVSSRFRLVTRRFQAEKNRVVAVYPSFIQLRKYELLAISNRLTDAGIKKIRKIGHQFEFDHIRKYVRGDDYRTINWKATARKADVMANQFEDEKSQQIISVIDAGRVMKMPFDGMTLLDYAINSSLVLSNISMLKQDKAGIISFSDRINSYLAPARNKSQMQKILEILYNHKTDFAESNFELLFSFTRKKLSQRSLLILYTNFESLNSLSRQMDFISRLKTYHVVMIVFFRNSGIRQLLDKKSDSLEDIYIKTIAEKFDFDKRQIVYELKKKGIYAIMTEPQNLTVSVINKYLELKAEGII